MPDNFRSQPSEEAKRFFLDLVKDPENKKDPAMVAAIAELYKALVNSSYL